jgi:hypothetical protein
VSMRVKIAVLSILILGVCSIVFLHNHAIAYRTLYYLGFHPRISLCDLAHHPEWYDGKIVRVRGQAQSIGDELILCDLPCNHPDAFSFINIEKLKTGANQYAKLLKALGGPGDENSWRFADVEVRGTFVSWYTQGCFGPRFGLKIYEFDALSWVYKVPKQSVVH